MLRGVLDDAEAPLVQVSLGEVTPRVDVARWESAGTKAAVLGRRFRRLLAALLVLLGRVVRGVQALGCGLDALIPKGHVRVSLRGPFLDLPADVLEEGRRLRLGHLQTLLAVADQPLGRFRPVRHSSTGLFRHGLVLLLDRLGTLARRRLVAGRHRQLRGFVLGRNVALRHFLRVVRAVRTLRLVGVFVQQCLGQRLQPGRAEQLLAAHAVRYGFPLVRFHLGVVVRDLRNLGRHAFLKGRLLFGIAAEHRGKEAVNAPSHGNPLLQRPREPLHRHVLLLGPRLLLQFLLGFRRLTGSLFRMSLGPLIRLLGTHVRLLPALAVRRRMVLVDLPHALDLPQVRLDECQVPGVRLGVMLVMHRRLLAVVVGVVRPLGVGVVLVVLHDRRGILLYPPVHRLLAGVVRRLGHLVLGGLLGRHRRPALRRGRLVHRLRGAVFPLLAHVVTTFAGLGTLLGQCRQGFVADARRPRLAWLGQRQEKAFDLLRQRLARQLPLAQKRTYQRRRGQGRHAHDADLKQVDPREVVAGLKRVRVVLAHAAAFGFHHRVEAD